jgi:hypothetical protein
MSASDEYLRFRDGVWYVGATGVQLYGVIALWLQGFSAEEIQASFTPLTLRDAYGAILAYLERRETLNVAFREQDARFDQLRAESEARDPTLYAEMRERVAQMRADSHRGRAS